MFPVHMFFTGGGGGEVPNVVTARPPLPCVCLEKAC